jgi:hypothetical protein
MAKKAGDNKDQYTFGTEEESGTRLGQEGENSTAEGDTTLQAREETPEGRLLLQELLLRDKSSLRKKIEAVASTSDSFQQGQPGNDGILGGLGLNPGGQNEIEGSGAGANQVTEITENDDGSPPAGFPAQILAVMNQKKSDFDISSLAGTNVYNSKLLCAIESALVEDRISRAWIDEVFNLARQSDSTFFNSQQETIDENITQAQDILSILNEIFARIRQFDQSFANLFLNPGSGESTYFTQQGLAKIKQQGASQDALLRGNSAFDAPRDLIKKAAFSEEQEKSVDDQKNNTTILGINLGLTQFFIGNNFFPVDDFKWFVDNGSAQLTASPSKIFTIKNKFSLQDFSSKDFMIKNIIDLDEMLDSIYTNPSSINSFNFTRIKMNLQLLCNEILNSAGIKRLLGTEIGSKFSVSENLTMNALAENLLGVQDINASTEVSKPGSVADYFIVDVNGSSRTQAGNKSILPFESQVSHKQISGLDLPPLLSVPTQEYAFSVLQNPTDNNFEIYDNILQAAKSNVDAAMEYYKILQNRDQFINLLSPRKLFAKIVEAIIPNLETSNLNSSTLPTNLLCETAFYFAAVSNKVNYTKYDAKLKLRRLLCTAIARSAYRKLQPNVQVSQQFTEPLSNTTTITTNINNGETQEIDTVIIDNTAASEVNNEDTSKIKFSVGNDLQNFGTKGDLYSQYTIETVFLGNKPANSSSYLPDNELDEIIDADLLETWRFLETNENSLTNKLAQIFVDMHQEAQSFLQNILSVESETFLSTPIRNTLANKLYGTALITLLYDTAAHVFRFLDNAAPFVWPEIGTVIFGSDPDINVQEYEKLKNLIASVLNIEDNSELTDEEKNDLLNNYNFEGIIEGIESGATPSPKLRIQIFKGISQSSIESKILTKTEVIKALKLIVEASNNDNFDSIYDSEGNVAALNQKPNEKIASTTLSFQQLQDLMEELAEMQDLPYACLTAHAVTIDRLIANSQNLSSLAENLESDSPPPNFQNFIDFAATPLGTNYLTPNITERTLELSQTRLNKIKKQNLEPIKKVERVTPGELACIRVIFQKLMSLVAPLGKQTIIFPVIGITPSQIKSNLISGFSILGGFAEGDPNNATFQLNMRRTGIFDTSLVRNSTYNFSIRELLDFTSFEDFEITDLNLDFDSIINNVKLSSSLPSSPTGSALGVAVTKLNLAGLKGSALINAENSNKAFRKQLLENEVISYLCRKAFSIISPLDLFSEDISDALILARDIAAPDLASNISSVLGLPNDAFNKVLLTQGGEISLFIKPNFFEEPLVSLGLNFAQLEFFADLFSTLYFDGTRTLHKTFAPVRYEKIICRPFIESTQNVFDFNEYEVSILPGQKLIESF